MSSGSDIDIFIYGSAEEFNVGKYTKYLNREIQIFTCKNKNDLKRLDNSLLKNIIKGDIIKGDINFLEVSIHA